MASADWTKASQLQARMPHTYTAMEHLIMAMADAYNSKGKKTLFGHDKGLKNYLKFEGKLKDALIALTLDGLGSRSDKAEIFRGNLILILDAWEEIFPNWPDAHTFAYEKLRANKHEANQLISNLLGVKV